MQLTYGEWNAKCKEIASTPVWHKAGGATLKAATKAWAGIGILASLFIGSAGYVIFGGTFAFEASPVREPAFKGRPAIDYVMNVAPLHLQADENQFQSYTAWLATAHAHAALFGQDALLPSQF
jgi:hypothetical protein